MSVTFYVQQVPTGWFISCACGDICHATSFLTHADALDAFVVGVKPECGDEFCGAMKPSIHAIIDGPEVVNVSNLNARHLLSVLGFEDENEDLCGSIAGSDFMGRILIAQAVNPADAGTATVTEGMMTTMGRPEGYTDGRLVEVEQLAQYAMDNNCAISWS